MSWIYSAIFCTYLLAMLGVGFYVMWKNNSTDDYYVGGCATLTLIITNINLPMGFGASILGIVAALITYLSVNFFRSNPTVW